MRLNIKLIITGMIMIIVGAMICGVSAGFLGFSINDLSTSEVITKEYGIEDPFRNIQISGDSGKIVLAKAADGKCLLVSKEYDNAPYTCRVENGTLIIEKQEASGWILNFNPVNPAGITLYLPEGEYGQLSIETDSGITDISDIMVEDFSFEGDSGLVSIKNFRCTDTMQLTVDSGGVNLEGIRCTDCITKGESGMLSMKDVIASRSIDIKRESGLVSFDGCDAGLIKVETESGAIKGTVLTGKTFKVDADSGIVKVPEDSGSGRFEITTESGLVTISVE